MRHLFVFLCLTLFLNACASNPTGGSNFVLMSESSEIAKGKEAHEELINQLPIYQDPKLQAYVNQIGQKVAASSHRPELTYTFTIIDSPDINAFALPGGYVYINRGLMAYLTTEAQLAAVLGHEIGHITARHSVRKQTSTRTAKIISGVLVVATGVPDIYETSSLVSGAMISGYGRDMELEADSLGAEYLYNAGYEPMAMVEVITALKNHENFSKRTSSQAVSYHGLFASHPRNDTRLQNVVGKAGKLSDQQQTSIDPEVFRLQMDGLQLGPSLQIAGNSQARNRYYQNLLNYTIVFPDTWTTEETTTTVLARDENNLNNLKIEVQRLNQVPDPRLYIQDNLSIPGLQKSEALSQFGLKGYTGINPATSERIAVIYYGPRAYILTGNADQTTLKTSDEELMTAIRSFRPIAANEQAYANPATIKYIRADGRNYKDLARESRLNQHAEDLLRLYNADYPAGEPTPGEWIKVVD